MVGQRLPVRHPPELQLRQLPVSVLYEQYVDWLLVGWRLEISRYLVKHFPGMFDHVLPVLVALRVDRVEVRVHVGLSDEDDEVVLGELAAVGLGHGGDGLEVILGHLDVVVPAELQVLGDGQLARVGGVRLVEYLSQS